MPKGSSVILYCDQGGNYSAHNIALFYTSAFSLEAYTAANANATPPPLMDCPNADCRDGQVTIVCPLCDGSGKKYVEMDGSHFWINCPCNGKSIQYTCPVCEGDGLAERFPTKE